MIKMMKIRYEKFTELISLFVCVKKRKDHQKEITCQAMDNSLPLKLLNSFCQR